MVGEQMAASIERALRGNAKLRSVAKRVDLAHARFRHRLAEVLPSTITPRSRQITFAITAACNLRCQGCHYGRDFMPGARLDLPHVCDAIDDAAAAGVQRVRFYGGEPLLHPDLAAMVRHTCGRGVRPYITTNATHLGLRIRELFGAGLRLATVGFYGIDEAYDGYTQKRGHFQRLERSLSAVRDQYGDAFELQLNFVLLRQTCTVAALEAAWAFAQRFEMFFHVDLANYAAPFFVRGFDNDLQLRPEDRAAAEEVARRMLVLKRAEPRRFLHSEPFIRSIPDWLLLGPAMRVACDAYDHIWVGADGTLQLCDVALPLGNLHQMRLRDVLFSPKHVSAARDGFRLNCPNCTCKAEPRIAKDAQAQRRYGKPMPGEGG
jgi:cyclic pyranopterin phosphate synthase